MAEVLSIPNSREGTPYFSSSPLGPPQSSSPHSFPLEVTREKGGLSFDESFHHDSSSTDASSDTSTSPLQTATDSTRRSSLHSTPPSSVSLDSRCQDDEDPFLPHYDDIPHIPLERFGRRDQDCPPPPPNTHADQSYEASLSSVTESTPTVDSDLVHLDFNPVADDTCVRHEPTRQVDYLSHDWREEDIWYSWRHITSRRRIYGERSRLENASWRTWAKSKYKLRTIPPESLNWLKDCDVTWLYGPLQQAPTPRQLSEPQSALSKNDSFLNKKPILKKRSVSEAMLQKSISTSSLIKQAAAVVQAQRRSPTKSHSAHRRRSRNRSFAEENAPFSTATNSTSDSGLQTPDTCWKKHIRFDHTVEQCIAVDFTIGDEAESESSRDRNRQFPYVYDDGESSEDDVIMMKARPRKTASVTSSRRNSLSQESNGIAMLPSTTIKFHHEDPPIPVPTRLSFQDANDLSSLWRQPRLNSSASQETLRPSHPATNFLLDPEDEQHQGEDDANLAWEPSTAFGHSEKTSNDFGPQPFSGRSSTPGPSSASHGGPSMDSSTTGLRRTSSGMFMPFDSDSDEEEQARAGSGGMFGRVVDTVNTARDIAHVIWNVGWRQ